MEVEVEIFLPSGACHCSTETFRRQMEEISKRIKEKYNMGVSIMYLPVNAKRAKELDIWTANTVAINGKAVLQGYYSASDVEGKILEAIKSQKV